MLMEIKIPSTIMNFSLVVRFLRFFLRAMTPSGHFLTSRAGRATYNRVF